MIKKAVILATAMAIFMLLGWLSPVIAEAQSGLEIQDSSVQAQFPASLSFNLSARSGVNITDIRLSYTVERATFAQVTSEVYIEFTPGTAVSVSWDWDMRKTGGLPPGSIVNYRWLVEDASGDRRETTPSRVQFDDNRYAWHSLSEGKVTLYWYQGSDTFAREIMLSAQDALARLAEDTGATLEKPVSLYIYATSQDLQGAMIYPQEWTGGVAYTRYGTIAIGIAPDNLAWGKRAIAHELTHLVIHQMTLNPYNELPTWLDEGLAMRTEGALGLEFALYLNKAIVERNLISVRSLSSPFSAYAEQSTLAYAESYSLVDFLIKEYGQARMLELLLTFRQGASYDGALEEVYSFDMDGLNTLWQAHVTSFPQAGLPAASPALAGLLPALATEGWSWR